MRAASQQSAAAAAVVSGVSTESSYSLRETNDKSVTVSSSINFKSKTLNLDGHGCPICLDFKQSMN